VLLPLLHDHSMKLNILLFEVFDARTHAHTYVSVFQKMGKMRGNDKEVGKGRRDLRAHRPGLKD